MINKMFVHLFATVFVVDWAENKGGSFMISDNVTGDFSFSCFKSFVGQVLETESGCVVSSSLLGIADPEGDMSWVDEEVPNLSIFPKAGRYACLASMNQDMLLNKLI